MITCSKASRNKDRFYFISPLWSKYKHVIKNKNTVSSWNITNMLSMNLKLYELLDDKDYLWNKAKITLSSIYIGNPIILLFATIYDTIFSVGEIDDIDYVHNQTIKYISDNDNNVKEHIEEYYNEGYKSIFKQNFNGYSIQHTRILSFN